MARLIKMDPARQALFMCLQDKMNASCLRKSSQAIFSLACLTVCAGLQLTEHRQQSRGQQEAFMKRAKNHSVFRLCCIN